MDKTAFYAFSYGIYLLTTRVGTEDGGCIINTAVQCASDPKLISVCVINRNHTCDMIRESGRFNLSVLPENAPYSAIRHFGMQSGRDVDKFASLPAYPRLENGLRVSPESVAVFACRVRSATDLGSHTLFVAEVEDAKTCSDARPMTYAYYQAQVKPKPQPVRKSGWRCKICGYVYEGETLPDNFVCPLCSHGADDFEKTEEIPNPDLKQTKGATTMKKWVCTVCGYVYEGEQPPAECPTCHVGADKFKEMSGDVKLAAQHEFGVYGQTVKNNPDVSDADKQYILEQLKANFDAECSEVGMYLCMARVAHREGYPEIGLYWEKAAYEEAEHAAKFAELLGEECEPNMKADTKSNLAWRVDCEFGATQGKVDLATCAKKNNLDAIHDTVHEMARDEARHGVALKGLLERYFK